MNWGWGETPSDVWFTPTDDWVVGEGTLNRNKKMIYDFKAMGA